MRSPEIALFKALALQMHRVAGHIAGLFGGFDHLSDQHIVEPAVLFGSEPFDQPGEVIGARNGAFGGVGLDPDLTDVEEARGTIDLEH